MGKQNTVRGFILGLFSLRFTVVSKKMFCTCRYGRDRRVLLFGVYVESRDGHGQKTNKPESLSKKNWFIGSSQVGFIKSDEPNQSYEPF